MANIYSYPTIFSSAGNPVTFAFSANTSNFAYFNCKVFEANSNTLLVSNNVYPFPDSPNYGFLNLSNILSSIVRSDIDNGNDIVRAKDKNIKGVYVQISDINTSLSAVTSTTSSTIYGYESKKSILHTENSGIQIWYGSAITVNSGFLTYKPNNTKVNEYSNEQLYFLVTGANAPNLIAKYSTVSGDYDYILTGGTQQLISNAVAPRRSVGTVTVTDTVTNINDNVGIYVNGSTFIGDVFVESTNESTTSIANRLATRINNYGLYSASNIGNVVSISGNTGTTQNGNTITGARVLTGATTTSSTAVIATAIISPSLPEASEIITVSVADPVFGMIDLCTYIANSSDASNAVTYATNLKNSINTNSYGYAARNAGGNIVLSARTNVSQALMNYQDAYIQGSSLSYGSGFFLNGQDGVTGGTSIYSAITISTTNFSGGTTGSSAVYATVLAPMHRLQVSPKKLIRDGQIPSDDFSNGNSYSVSVWLNDFQLIQPRTYLCVDSDCSKEYVNILFQNSLGGVDSFQFQAPQQSVKIDRKTSKKNNYDIKNDTYYTSNSNYELQDVKFNRSEQVYESNSVVEITVWTDFLSDTQAEYLIELVQSKDIYLESNIGRLLPVTLVDTTYKVIKSKYSPKLNQYQFTFQFDDNLLPNIDDNISFVVNQPLKYD